MLPASTGTQQPGFQKRRTQAYALGVRVREMYPKSSVAQIARALGMPQDAVRSALPRTSA
jgi:hypothetical protein